MSLTVKYQAILDTAFQNNVPDWQTLSPLDPMKVIAESLTHSFAAIEQRQTRYTQGVLDSLPALFSFHPKRAQYPVGMVSFQASPRLTEPRSVSGETQFRFQTGDHTVYAIACAPIRILPLQGLTAKTSGARQLTFTFTSQGRTDEFSFHALASDHAAAVHKWTVRLTDLATGLAKEFTSKDLVFQDETEGFKRTGYLRWTSRQVGRLICEAPSQVDITLEFAAAVPKSQFALNAVACFLCDLKFDAALAKLAGEPWEEIRLPEAVVTPPSELKIYFPDGQIHALNRIDTDLLKLRHTDAKRFQQSFFYNAVNHSLVIPQADVLMQHYNGAVEVRTARLLLAPQFEITQMAFQGGNGDFSAVIDKVDFLRVATPFFAREASSEYLKRFYASLRSFNAQSSAGPGLILADIRTKLINSEDAIAQVDFAVDTELKSLTVYVLTRAMEEGAESTLDRMTTTAAAEILNKIVPLDYTWKIEAFAKVNLTVSLKAELELSEGRLGSITAETFSQLANEALNELLAREFSESDAASQSLAKDKLLSRLKEELGRRHGIQILPEEIVRLEALVRNEITGVYCVDIIRNPGEYFTAHVESNVAICLESLNAPREIGWSKGIARHA